MKYVLSFRHKYSDLVPKTSSYRWLNKLYRKLGMYVMGKVEKHEVIYVDSDLSIQNNTVQNIVRQIITYTYKDISEVHLVQYDDTPYTAYVKTAMIDTLKNHNVTFLSNVNYIVNSEQWKQ